MKYFKESFNFKKISRVLLIFLVIAANVSCDQISKHQVREKIWPGQTFSMLNGHFILTNVENSGAFLSLGDSLPGSVKDILLSLLPLLAIVGFMICILVKPSGSTLRLFAFCFILGGGIGNIYDRIVYGSVTDFLHLDLYFFRTGIFNGADISIILGLFFILLSAFEKKEDKLQVS